MVKVFAIIRPIVRLLMKFYGLSPQIIETEPGTKIKVWMPSKLKTETKPNIVFLHGFGADGIFNWLSQVMALSSTYAVYVPDLLFFGESITDKPGRSTAFQAEVIAAALKKAGVKKCTVVGLSYGASIGFKMAELCPELVEFVVASDTVIEFTESLSRVAAEKHGFSSLQEFLLPTTVEGLMAFLTVCNHGPVSMPAFVAKDFLKEFYNNRKERAELADAWVVPDNEVKPISLSQKVHLVWGDDDKIFTSQTAEDTKRQLGGDTTLVYIKDGGHVVQQEKANEYNVELNKILASLHTKSKDA
ncbi:uncharacterized protein LOC141668013 [Apium graveolens]|uniref:uncharacterized protein LOC141668013 n=1 Tax=Apium graveolens TaxID=4045 RepID=UPI003D79E632